MIVTSLVSWEGGYKAFCEAALREESEAKEFVIAE
jgi:hypothetical protein